MYVYCAKRIHVCFEHKTNERIILFKKELIINVAGWDGKVLLP